MGNSFFNGWTGIYRTLLIGALAYGALIFLLRVSGKRTLSKMNAFDLIVTVALGSTLATILLSRDVALAEGVAALALLIFLQFAITWLSLRVPAVQRLIKAEPALLLHRGELCRGAMRRERVTEEEIHAAIRSSGQAALEEVEAVVLETDGTFTVIGSPRSSSRSILKNVVGFEAEAGGQESAHSAKDSSG